MYMETKPTMIRLRADTRALLEKAATDQRRSMASLVDESIKEHLAPRYAPVNERLTRFLGN
jgi:uncharacterized protein (DUF1778 family)